MACMKWNHLSPFTQQFSHMKAQTIHCIYWRVNGSQRKITLKKGWLHASNTSPLCAIISCQMVGKETKCWSRELCSVWADLSDSLFLIHFLFKIQIPSWLQVSVFLFFSNHIFVHIFISPINVTPPPPTPVAHYCYEKSVVQWR